MNLYFLVEGFQTEKRVYSSWIEQVFPTLNKAETLGDVRHNTYRLFSIEGNTDRVDNIQRALAEIERHNKNAESEGRGIFDHLFVCLDAEDAPLALKISQVENLISGRAVPTLCHPIVHNCCLETWFLGNKAMMKRRNLQNEQLKIWKEFYDVSTDCPELMGKPDDYRRSKAWFHHDYLKVMLKERNVNYSKKSPNEVRQKTYFQALIDRYESTGHLDSFGRLINLWRSIGGNL